MYIKLLFIILQVILSNLITLNAEDPDCTKNIEDFKCTFTSKTPYRYIRNNNDSQIEFSNCEAKKIFLLIRHGTRLPGDKVYLRLDTLKKIQHHVIDVCLKKSSCSLNHEQITDLIHWKLRFLKTREKLLVEEGEREMTILAERYQSRFPKIMPEKYSNKTYKFKFTATQRAEESAKYFTIGLFGKRQAKHIIYPKPESKDPILRFYKRCEKWLTDVKKNPASHEEFMKFQNTDVTKKMLKTVSERLGFDVDFEDVKAIRLVCAYETAGYGKSPFCPLLSYDDFKIMEFADDLRYFWTQGYAYSITYEQSCPVLRDMFEFFKANDTIKASAYFTHSGTMLKLLSLLGVGDDKKVLRHDSYETSKGRLWRTSFIDAFATNIAFILYDCKLSEPSILVMHQERIVNLPGCPENVPCPLSIMQEKYPDRAEECEFDKICMKSVQ